MSVKTFADFLVVSLIKKFPMIGKSLQYHKCKRGPTYVEPTRKRLRFLLRSILGFLSMTEIRKTVPNWVMASPKEKRTPLVSILVISGYLSRRRVYFWNMKKEELETSAYYNFYWNNLKMYFKVREITEKIELINFNFYSLVYWYII